MKGIFFLKMHLDQNNYIRILHNLPKLPDSVVDELIFQSECEDKNMLVARNSSEEIHTGYENKRVFGQPLKWLATNIDPLFKIICVRNNWRLIRFVIDKNSSTECLPHTDATTKSSLCFILKDGDGINSFYETGPSIATNIKIFPQKNNLVKVFDLQMPQKTWYILRGEKPHSVSNMTSTRILLVRGFAQSLFSFNSCENK